MGREGIDVDVKTSHTNPPRAHFSLVRPSIFGGKHRLPNMLPLWQVREVSLRYIQDKQGRRGKDMAIKIQPTI